MLRPTARQRETPSPRPAAATGLSPRPSSDGAGWGCRGAAGMLPEDGSQNERASEGTRGLPASAAHPRPPPPAAPCRPLRATAAPGGICPGRRREQPGIAPRPSRRRPGPAPEGPAAAARRCRRPGPMFGPAAARCQPRSGQGPAAAAPDGGSAGSAPGEGSEPGAPSAASPRGVMHGERRLCSPCSQDGS